MYIYHVLTYCDAKSKISKLISSLEIYYPRVNRGDLTATIIQLIKKSSMTSNKYHNWFKRGDLTAAFRALCAGFGALDQSERRAKMAELDERGRTPLAVIAGKAQTHSHILSHCTVLIVYYNFEALTTRDKEGKTPIDIASRSGACAEIIGLLSLTPEEARSLGWKEMRRLYAPVGYWWDEMAGWIKSRSWADCHKWINEHDDELVREVLLKYCNSNILLQVLNLPNIHRFPLYFAESFKLKAFREIQKGCLPHPQGNLLHPLPHPPPTTPLQAVRRLVNLRHLQHRLHVHQAHEVQQC